MTGKTFFGFDPVTFKEKTEKVQGVFNRVASRYDLMNDLMSGGLHRLWKKSFVDRLPLFPKAACLDVAGGTGDIAFRLSQKQPSTQISVCDLTLSMLQVGRDRGYNRGLIEPLTWTCASAEALPYPNDTFDFYTISFGLRNVTDFEAALRESYRVLRPGGRFYCLEFSKVQDPFFKKIYEAYTFQIIPKMGALVARDEASYRYLAESIHRFPEQSLLAASLEQVGFSQVSYENLSDGIVAIHMATK